MPASSPPQALKALTTVRFFAAAWVAVYHYWPQLTTAPAPAVVARGYLGVELFFVLSGFILCHVYLPAFGEGRFGYGAFLKARFARIWPLHIATLLGGGLLALVARRLAGGSGVGGFVVWSSLPAQLSMTQAWGLGTAGGWNHPSWSISAEWAAYLAFPAFAWAAWRCRKRPLAAVAGAAIGAMALYAVFPRLAGFPLTAATVQFGALRIVPCFGLGCAVWLAWRAEPGSGPRVAIATVLAVVATMGGALFAGAPDALIVLFSAALIWALARLAGSGSQFMGGRLGPYLGEVSYAIYMVAIPWQLLVVDGSRRLLGLTGPTLPWPLWALMAAGLLPAAMLAHHLIEAPARSAIRAWRIGSPRGAGLQRRVSGA